MSKSKSETENRYQFETALPMDEAMQRLHDQMGRVRHLPLPIRRYKISSGKQGDSINFEIVRRPSRYSHKLVVTGTIREIDQNQTILECQVKGNDPIRHTAIWALPLFLTLMLATRDFPLPEMILLSLAATAVLLFAFAPARFPELGADDIERIEEAIGSRESPEKNSVNRTDLPVPD